MALAHQNSVGLGSGDTGVRRDDGMQVNVIQKPDTEIDLIEGEPTLQQQQAYELFWKLFIERMLRERRLDESG